MHRIQEVKESKTKVNAKTLNMSHEILIISLSLSLKRGNINSLPFLKGGGRDYLLKRNKRGSLDFKVLEFQ